MIRASWRRPGPRWWRQPDLDVTTDVLVGPPIPTLVEESGAARLMVVGSRGLGGFRGMLVGSRGRGAFAGVVFRSTSQALVYHAPCPLIVARG